MIHSLKNFILTVTALVATSTFAIQNSQNREYDQGHGIKESQMMGAYNEPARIDLKGAWDLFITTSFIYWQAREYGLDFAIETQLLDEPHHSNIIYLDFDYKPGFKIGAGINSTHDNWNVYAEYTCLHLKDRSSLAAPDEGILIPTWSHIKDELEETDYGNLYWHLDVDILDLEIGRPCYIGTKLTFKPHFGLKASWFDQRCNVKYITHPSAAADEIIKNKNKKNSWLVGPRAGLDANWLLGKGFKIFGNGAVSLTYQRSKTSHKLELENLSGNNVAPTFVVEKMWQVEPILELALGIGWGSYLRNNKCHLDLAASYDFLLFWDQNTMRTLTENVQLTISNSPGDLMLHGLTMTARFDF